MKTLTADEKTRLEILQNRFETCRNAYIRRDGQIFVDRQYPHLDEISGEMFRILSGGTDHIVLDAEWIAANAEPVTL